MGLENKPFSIVEEQMSGILPNRALLYQDIPEFTTDDLLAESTFLDGYKPFISYFESCIGRALQNPGWLAVNAQFLTTRD